MINGFHFGYNDSMSGNASAAGAASAAQSAAGSARRELKHLEDRHDRLALVCMAMWSLIQDKTNLTEEDLLSRVHTLDMMDGSADGKATKGISKCHKCGRTLNARHRKCLYCGAARPASSAFDQL